MREDIKQKFAMMNRFIATSKFMEMEREHVPESGRS
jgi:hypothetical protein